MIVKSQVKLKKPLIVYVIKTPLGRGEYKSLCFSDSFSIYRKKVLTVDSDHVALLKEKKIESGMFHSSPSIKNLYTSLKAGEWSCLAPMSIIKCEIPAGEVILRGVNYECSPELNDKPAICSFKLKPIRAIYVRKDGKIRKVGKI
jgi:hypothetical protein